MNSLQLRLEPSSTLRWVVTALHALALLAAWGSTIATGGKLGLAGAIVASWELQRRRSFGLGRDRCLLYTPRSGWAVATEGREPQPLTVLPSSVVSPWLVVLHGRIGGKRRDWVIARDSLDAESFRQLRVLLRVFARSSRVRAASTHPAA